MVPHAKFFLGMALAIVLLAGCATDETYRAHQDAGGTLPWNRPQSWEGPAAMGGSQMNSLNR